MDPQYRQIRDTYEQFLVGETVIAMVSDPVTPDAWIQSDVRAPIRR